MIRMKDSGMTEVDEGVLDHPVWSSLTGKHAHLGARFGAAARYPADVAVFAAIAPEGDDSAWVDLAALTEPGETLAVVSDGITPGEGWDTTAVIEGVQMVDVSLDAVEHPDVQLLGLDDVPEMLALVERTRPGPFAARTIEMGRYFGLRRGGSLVAMAGQRLHPNGWAEISGVCTDTGFRRQGLGTLLVRAITADIRSRGETPFLHASADNTNAIRLYEHLGMRIRRRVSITVVRRSGPDRPGAASGVRSGP